MELERTWNRKQNRSNRSSRRREQEEV